MAERIEYPQALFGTPEDQIVQLRRYLYRLVDVLNGNQQTTDNNLITYVSRQAEALRKITGQSEYSTITTEDVATQADELKALLTKAMEALQNIQRLSGYVTTTSFPSLFVQSARETEITPAAGTGSFYLATDFLTAQQNISDLQETAETAAQDISDLQETADTAAQDISDLQTGLAEKEDSEAAGTTETDADQLTIGKYLLTADSTTQTNFPATITDGDVFLIEVMGISSSVLMQRITTAAEVFIRTFDETTWTSWYSYPGTIVT